MSEGMLPSDAWMTWTTCHSPPLAEWMVDSTRKSSSRCGGPARSLVLARRVEGELGQERGCGSRYAAARPTQLLEVGDAGAAARVVAAVE